MLSSHSPAPMAGYASRRLVAPDPQLLARIHDIGTGLAIGIGFLKAITPSAGDQPSVLKAQSMLEESLGQLRRLTRSLSEVGQPTERPSGLEESLVAEAARLGLILQLEVAGDDRWVAPNQARLMLLVGREALRNVRRHSGSSTCHVALELSTCPFVLRVRDWGAGLQSGSGPSNGLTLLRRLAAEQGCTISVSSSPGLGTEVELSGPPCPLSVLTHDGAAPDGREAMRRGANKTRQDGDEASESGQSRRVVGRSVRRAGSQPPEEASGCSGVT